MAVLHKCPACGMDLPGDVLEGLCPSCLLHSGLESAAHLPGGGASQGPFIAAAPAELAQSFPQLEILELLGQGGMGAVYKARQSKLGRLVALKVLPPSLCKDPAFAERFTREARALARLCHPNIVAVHDFGEVDGLFYFVMEYVDGANLRQVLLTGRLTPAEALRIVPQVCEALQYAHEEGIVHRDIKPENILLDQKGRVKVADFGLAKLVGPTPGTFTLTGSRQVVGTPHYMAPEQMEKPHTVDHRADIYSLGVVLYEMLTGELPLGRFAPPSHKAAVNVRLDDVVLRALAKEPEHRYQRVSDVKEQLAEAAELSARSATPQPRTGRTRALCIPFSHSVEAFDKWLNGMLRWDGDCLTLEMEVLEWGPGFFNREQKKTLLEKQIPLADLQSIRIDEGLWRLKLVVRGTRLSVLGDVPGSSHGQLILKISWADRADAETLVAKVSARCQDGDPPFLPAARAADTANSETTPRQPQPRGRLRGKLRSLVQAARYWMVDSMALPRELSVVSEPATEVKAPQQPQGGRLRRLLGNTVGNSVVWAILVCLVGTATVFMPWSSTYSTIREYFEGFEPIGRSMEAKYAYLLPDGTPLTLPKNITLGRLYQHVPNLRGIRGGFSYPEGIVVASLFGGLAVILIATSSLGTPRIWRALLMIPCGAGVLIAAGVYLAELPRVLTRIPHSGRDSDYYARRLGLTHQELYEAINEVLPYLDLWPAEGPFVAIGLAVALLLLGSLQLRSLFAHPQRA